MNESMNIHEQNYLYESHTCYEFVIRSIQEKSVIMNLRVKSKNPGFVTDINFYSFGYSKGIFLQKRNFDNVIESLMNGGG